ncbi:MAG: tRNA dihydrouridine(20/20a) synthase DusA [Burkholderiaceae bacterium]
MIDVTSRSSGGPNSHLFCVAPMMEWTDRHCRYFHRQLSRHARLYTEMLTTGTLLHGDAARHLAFDADEHPVALQLGGSEPEELARAAKLGARYGYDEINLNCGCPSERVQRGAFGACLMAEPSLVAACIRAMQDAVAIPVTVKHRLGVDHRDDYGFVRDFVGALHVAGCSVFIVHARSAWLKGLSPKENREVPPLDSLRVHQLKQDFPAAKFVLNGGITTLSLADEHLDAVDGVMMGRAAYHDPYLLASVDQAIFGDASQAPTRKEVVLKMTEYLREQTRAGTAPRHIARHMLGLFQGLRGARQWRRTLSDADALRRHGADVLMAAFEAVREPALLSTAA